jgi:hypothetical protein
MSVHCYAMQQHGVIISVQDESAWRDATQQAANAIRSSVQRIVRAVQRAATCQSGSNCVHEHTLQTHKRHTQR